MSSTNQQPDESPIRNVILILCDTLTRDKLSPYHKGEGPYGHIQTPNLDRLAARGVTFTNHWINSAPCMPARRDLCSGRIEFPWRSWGPRESFDPDWALELRNTEVSTCLFTDHANLFDVGAGNYHHWYDHYEFVRGHYNDHCATVPPVAPGRPGHPRRIYEEAYASVDAEEKTFVARNLGNVAHWLDEHGDSASPFFLMVDEFDPHWPLDPPEPYRSQYLADKRLAEKDLDTFFKSARAEDHTDEDLEWLNAQCAGKITLVDRWLGEVLDRMDRHGLWENTLFLLTSDHGEFIGEYDQMSKGGGFSYPLFSRIPLLASIPCPEKGGREISALTSTVDLHATVLEALGREAGAHTHSRSLLPLLRGDAEAVRDSVIYGWWGKGFYWTDGERLLCKAPEKPGPLYQYGTDLGEKYTGLKGASFDRYAGAESGVFLPHTDRPVYRVPSDGMAYGGNEADFDALFDLRDDPACRNNLFDPSGEKTRAALAELVGAMKAHSVPKEHFKRLGLTDGLE